MASFSFSTILQELFFSLSRNRPRAGIQSVPHRMPCQAGAFHAGRKLADTGKSGKFAQMVKAYILECPHHQFMEHRKPRTLECQIDNRVTLELHIEGIVVAAKWIETLQYSIGAVELFEIPGAL